MESTFKLANMHSPDCVRLLTNAIQDLPCITHVEVSLQHQTVRVEHTRMVAADDILQAIIDAGFAADDTSNS